MSSDAPYRIDDINMIRRTDGRGMAVPFSRLQEEEIEGRHLRRAISARGMASAAKTIKP